PVRRSSAGHGGHAHGAGRGRRTGRRLPEAVNPSQSAHPRERGDPVLWVMSASSLAQSVVLKRQRQAGQDWIPTFVGMSGKEEWNPPEPCPAPPPPPSPWTVSG